MSFHLYPTNPMVQQLFKAHPAGLKQKRKPIAERARQTREATQARIPLETASNAVLENYKRSDWFYLNLAGNQFQLLYETKKTMNKIAEQVVSHIGGILENCLAAIWIIDEPKNVGYTVKVEVKETKLKIKKSTPPLPLEGEKRLDLKFKIFKLTRELHLGEIETEPKGQGLGGRVAAALYNIGKDLGMEMLNFTILERELNAAQFYYHIDYGQPIREKSRPWGRWVIVLYEPEKNRNDS